MQGVVKNIHALCFILGADCCRIEAYTPRPLLAGFACSCRAKPAIGAYITHLYRTGPPALDDGFPVVPVSYFEILARFCWELR